MSRISIKSYIIKFEAADHAVAQDRVEDDTEGDEEEPRHVVIKLEDGAVFHLMDLHKASDVD